MSLDDRINNAPNDKIRARRMLARGDSIESIAAAFGVDIYDVQEWVMPRPVTRPKRELVTGIVVTFAEMVGR
jgi:hypothetical protein